MLNFINILLLFKNLFLNNKGLMLRAIFNLLITNPIFVFQVTVFVLNPSFKSFLLIIIGTLAGHIVYNIKLMVSLALDTYRFLKDVLKGLSGKTYSIKSILDTISEQPEYIYDDMENYFVQFNGARSKRFDDIADIHVDPGCCLLKCYTSNLLFKSHIVLGNIPKKRNALQKYLVLHEICHVLVRMISQPTEIFAGMLPNYLFFAWVLLFVDLNANSIILLLSILIAMLLWQEGDKIKQQDFRLVDEILADTIALAYISKEDVIKLLDNKYIFKLLNDESMSSIQNEIRLSIFKKNAQDINDNSLDIKKVIHELKFDRVVSASILILFTKVFLLVLPSIYYPSPTWMNVFTAFLVLLITTVIFVISLFSYFVIEGLTSKRLEALFPKAEVSCP